MRIGASAVFEQQPHGDLDWNQDERQSDHVHRDHESEPGRP